MIFREEDVCGRERVTTDEEQSLTFIILLHPLLVVYPFPNFLMNSVLSSHWLPLHLMNLSLLHGELNSSNVSFFSTITIPSVPRGTDGIVLEKIVYAQQQLSAISVTARAEPVLCHWQHVWYYNNFCFSWSD